MTRPKIGRYPVSSFGPELMELLIQGSQRRVEIPCENMKQMKHLQMRIHTLRGAMARERHPQYALATRARTSCTWDHEKFPGRFPKNATNCVLVIAPNDSQFSDILAKAGITPSQGAKDVLEDLALPDVPTDPSIQSATETPTTTNDDSTPTIDPYARFKQ